MMDLVNILHDDIYMSKVLFSNTPNHINGLTVKVMHRTFMYEFRIRNLNRSLFPGHMLYLVYVSIMIDIEAKC